MVDDTKVNPYDEQLEENKRQYNAGEIDKDLYQKRARSIRKKRRDWNRRNNPDHPTVGATSTKATNPDGTLKRKRGKRPRKKKPGAQKLIGEDLKLDRATLDLYLEEMREYFTSVGLAEAKWLSYQGSFHATMLPEIIKAKLANPEKKVGQALYEKFIERWGFEPKIYVTYQQGDVPVMGLGPIMSFDEEYKKYSKSA